MQTAVPPHSESAEVAPPASLFVALVRTLLKSVVWFFVLLLGIMGLSVLALQTQSGQTLLTQTLEKQLRGPGYSFSLTQLRGQLPTNFYLDHLAFMDQDGVWLELDKLHIAWSLSELFRGKIHIEEVSADTVHLHRKPVAAPTEKKTASPSASAKMVPFLAYLPPFLLDQLFISNIILDSRVTGQEARFSLKGQMILDTDGQRRDRDRLRAKLEIRPQDTAETYLTLEGYLFPRSQADGPLGLELTVEGRENSGLTASWTGLPQAKSLAFHLAGKGPLDAWQGELAVTVEGLGQIQSQLASLQVAAAGSTPVPALQLQGTLVTEAGILPAQLATLGFALQTELPDLQHIRLSRLDLTTPFASLNAQGMVEIGSNTLTLQAKLDIPHLESLLSLPDNPLSGHAIASLQADGPVLRPHWTLTTQIDDPKAVDWQAKQLVGTFAGDFSADLDEPQTTLQMHGQGEVLDLYRTEDPARFQETLTWSTDLNITTLGKVQIAKLEIKDPAMTVGLQGTIEIPQGEGSGDFRWTLDHFSHLEKLSALAGTAISVAGVEGEGLVTGNFHWSAVSPTLKEQEPVRLALTGTFSALQGVPAAVQALVGSSLETQLNVAIWPGEKLAFTDIDIRGKGLHSLGNLQANLVNGTLTSTFQTTLPELEVLAPVTGIAMAGKLSMDTTLSGTFHQSDLQVSLSSDSLKLEQRPLKNLRAVLLAHTLNSTPYGTVTVRFEDHGEKIDTALAYRLDTPWLTVSDLLIRLPGSTLTGEKLKINLAQGVVDGQLRGRSETLIPLVDWLAQTTPKPIDPSIDSVADSGSTDPLIAPRLRKPGNPSDSALSGAMEIVVALTSANNRQDMTANLQAQLIRGPSFFLENAQMKATGQDLFGEAQGSAEISLGQFYWNKTKLRSGKLTATGTRQSTQINLQAKGQLREPFELDIKGAMGMDAQGVVHGTLAGLTGTIGQDALLLEQESRITWTPSKTRDRSGTVLNFEPLSIRYGPARLHGHAYYDSKRVEIDFDLGLPLSTTARFWGPNLLGTAQLEAKFRGAPNNPQGQLDLRLDQIRLRDPQMKSIPAADVVAHGVLENGQVSTRVTIRNLSPTPMIAQISTPMQMAFSPFHFNIPPQGTLDGEANANVRIEPIAALFALDAQKLEGLIKVALQLHGSVAAPDVQGTILLSDGRYENGNSGTLLKDIHFTMVAKNQTIILEKLEAKDEEHGSLYATGRLLVDGEQNFPFQGEVSLDKMTVVQRDDLHSVMSGRVGVRGDSQLFKINGDLTGEELLFYFSESVGQDVESVRIDAETRNGLDVGTEKASTSTDSHIDLDVALHLPRRVFARGRGLESEWFGDLTLRGSVDEPLVLGQLRIRRGYFEFLDRRFELRKGIISLDGASPPQPNIDLEAESQANEMLALLVLQGPLFSPKLTLSSEPTMPKDEILSRLLFNRNSQQLSPTQALGLLSAIRQLRGGGPSLLGKARDSFGIDRLDLEGDGLESSSVRAGKYLNDNVFIGVERGLNQGSGKVSVEWELTPSVTVETEVNEGNNSSIGMNWKHDY